MIISILFRKIARAATLVGGIGAGIFGQSPALPTSLSPAAASATPLFKPDADYHALYRLFFSHHTLQSQGIDNLRGTSSQQAAAADAAVAAKYKITVAELATLNRFITSTAQKLDVIEAEAKGLLKASNNSPAAPLQVKLDDINSRRYRTVIAGLAAIRKSLPPTSWNNVRAFINNEFRNSTLVIK